MASKITKEQQFHSLLSQNLHALIATKKKINSQINVCLRKDDSKALRVYTNVYLLVYNAWTEASLVHLVHTPFGFNIDEKEKILKDRDVLNKWKKCVDTAFVKFRKGGADIPNKKKKIFKLLSSYLKDQAVVRNKIAHGQWEYPLQKNNLKHDEDAQVLISLIDVIQIDTWFEVFKEIIGIVRALIDSKTHNNHKAHYNHYYQRLENIRTIIDDRKRFSIEEKAKNLKRKQFKNCRFLEP